MRLADHAVATVWQWEQEAHWEAAQEVFGPYLQEHLVPLLAGPPDRFAGDLALHIRA